MGSKNISLRRIEDLCIELMSNIIKQWQVYKKCKRIPDWIEDNYIGGISESVFICVINKSKNNFMLRSVLPFIVSCVTDESITDKIFSLLFYYGHHRTKDQVLIALSHKHLPVHLLRKLCETNRCFECYFELAISIYQNDATSAGDVQEVMDYFLRSPYAEMIKELLSEMNALSTTNVHKKRVLEAYERRYVDGK